MRSRSRSPKLVLAGTLLAVLPLLAGGCTNTGPQSGAAPGSAGSSQSPSQASPRPTESSPATTSTTSPSPSAPRKRSSNATIVKRSTVPVLCWHQIRDWRASDSANDRTYITPPKLFAAQLAGLRKAGYHSITPDELYEYLVFGTALPKRPVLLSLDDGWETEWVAAGPLLAKNGQTATYFITTQGINVDTWVSAKQIRAMQAAGMTVADHTTSHADARHYSASDWKYQLTASLKKLDKIVGHPIEYFAYPYGAWNEDAFKPLAANGIKLAFQLTDKPIDSSHPLLTQRRMLMDGRWSAGTTLSMIKRVFGKQENRASNY